MFGSKKLLREAITQMQQLREDFKQFMEMMPEAVSKIQTDLMEKHLETEHKEINQRMTTLEKRFNEYITNKK